MKDAILITSSAVFFIYNLDMKLKCSFEFNDASLALAARKIKLI